MMSKKIRSLTYGVNSWTVTKYQAIKLEGLQKVIGWFTGEGNGEKKGLEGRVIGLKAL